MKTFLKVLGILFVLILVAAFGGIKFLENKKPEVPLVDLNLKADSITLSRGEYLAKHVAVCLDCHSTRNFDLIAGPIVPGTEGKGGELFGAAHGFPGDFYAPNITPYHLGKFNDAELYRMVSSGVGSNGFGIFPVMPWPKYGKSDKEDIAAILSYIRTLPSIKYDVPESQPKFPMTFIRNLMPKAATPNTLPSIADTVKYGEYLVRMASCASCHTQQDKGKPLPGMDFAGGFEMKHNKGTNYSANITPDNETGIGTWSKEMFVARFKAYADSTYASTPVAQGEFQTIMPWTAYAGMTETDLAAIYSYLMSLAPVKNEVKTFIP